MKNKIYLNILGFKKFDDEQLEDVSKEVEELAIAYDSILREPLNELIKKIRVEQNRRKNSKLVLVEFVCSWSGYSNNSSAPRRDVARHYRKVDRKVADKMPKYFCHNFSDGSTNDWSIKIVSVKGKNESLQYGNQVDEFLKENKLI